MNPQQGLHFEDVKKLLEVLHELVDQGNSVVVIEHNLDVIKTADHIIDIGPEGGDGGGTIVATGTPEDVALAPGSHTGRYLKDILTAKRVGGRVILKANFRLCSPPGALNGSSGPEFNCAAAKRAFKH